MRNGHELGEKSPRLVPKLITISTILMLSLNHEGLTMYCSLGQGRQKNKIKKTKTQISNKNLLTKLSRFTKIH
jgi:hypothetical protein